MRLDVYKEFLGKFGEFTDIQEKAIPIIGSGKNCVVVAPTGSGKTEAALLPVLSSILKNPTKGVQVFYVTPLRALNRDMLKRIEQMCKAFGISVGVRHGDTTRTERLKQAAEPPQVLITTPESLQTFLTSKKMRPHATNVRHIIIDELHELYYNKRGAQLSVALERLVELAGEFQRIGISATVGDPKIAAFFLCGKRECEVADTSRNKKLDMRIDMPKMPSKQHEKFEALFALDKESMARLEYIEDLIKQNKATLIFSNTRQVAESLGNKLVYLDKEEHFGGIAVHHSSLNRAERVNVEDSFKEGKLKAVISTSSLELGIDIGNIELVIQYNSPRQVTRLLQRVGRSGHGKNRISNGRIIVASLLDAIEAAAAVQEAEAQRLEKQDIEKMAFDVLANQISSVAFEYGTVDVNHVFKIVKRASPYLDLKRSEFNRVLEFVIEENLVNLTSGSIRRGSRGLRYNIENISVIPDKIRFLVKNVTTNRIISTLDEKFVSNYLEEGSSFITKGLPWQVINIEENVVYVEPTTNMEATIPDWEGEDIPVTYEVASKAFLFLEKGKLPKSVADAECNKLIERFYGEQRKAFPLNEKILNVEILENYALLYLPYGRKANEFFARTISTLLQFSQRTRTSVRSTPYAVIIDYSAASRKPNVRKALDLFQQLPIRNIINNGSFLNGSELFRYKFVQICKLFGVVEKRASITRSVADKLINFYKNSVVFDETLRDLYKNYFELGRITNLQKELVSGKMQIHFYEGESSALARQILDAVYYYREFLGPLSSASKEVDEFKLGLMSKTVEMMCTYCGFRFSRKLETLKENEKILCGMCKSPMVTLFKDGYDKIIEKRKAEKRLTTAERKEYDTMLKGAGLVSAYGVRALLALSTYGVGLDTAARVLRMFKKDTRDFVVDLIKAEKQFVRTKKYWAH